MIASRTLRWKRGPGERGARRTQWTCEAYTASCVVWKDDDIERGEWNWNARVVKGSPTMGRPVAMETLARTAAEAMASCEAMMELPL